MAKDSKLVVFNLGTIQLRYRVLGHNQIGNVGADHLAAMLRDNHSLKELYISTHLMCED